MSTPPFIEAAGLRIPISDGWGGPQLACSGTFEALGWVVNTWLQGEFPDLLERVERGEDADDPMVRGFFAATAGPEDITAERKARWKELTGNDVGNDPVLVGSPMTRHSFLLPRDALVLILRAAAKMRAEAAKRPRIPPSATSASAVLASPLPPQLFTRQLTIQPPTEEERVALGDVEDAATRLDAMRDNAKTDAERHQAIAARRELFDALESYGLLDEARAPEKRAWLEGFRLPTLRDYVDAAIALRAYYRNPVRVQYIRTPAPQRLLEGSVSLDWFRIPTPIPPGTTRDSWLALAEHLVQETTRTGESGKIFASVGDRRYEVLWRRDYDKPAVFATREALR